MRAGSDIFLSYDRSDRVRARRYADALEGRGWSVFWDTEIPPGQLFDQVIEEELNAARCVVVLWSKESIQSRWVKTEASAGAEKERLVPVLIDEVTIPFEFRRIQTAELSHWDGDTSDAEFTRFVEAVAHKLGQPELAPARSAESPARTALTPWWQTRSAIIAASIAIAGIVIGSAVYQRAGQSAPDADDAFRSEPSDPGPGSGSGPGSSSAPRSSGTAAVPDGAFKIAIGNRIDDGIPGPGAGSIEQPYSVDHYVFDAEPGQSVYFRMMRHSRGLESIQWALVDDNGMEIFKTCLGCTEPGVQDLTRGGRYVLSVGSDNDASTGTYQLRLFAVPRPTRLSVNIGDEMRGEIESPGAGHIYTFTARPRQRIYFRMREHSSGLAYIKWVLTDDDESEVFNACLGCTEPGVQTLTRGGTYTLTVQNKVDPSTGTYRLQLFDVPPADQSTIRIGERVESGSIQSPGAEDVYTFMAARGQKVSFRMVERSRGTDYLKWRLVDEDGMEVFNTCLGCSDPGVQTLVRGGKYTLTVGNSVDPSTGTYVFETGAR